MKLFFLNISQLLIMNYLFSQKPELFMVDISAKTYCINNIVVKSPRIDDKDFITMKNFKVMCNKVSIYTLLREH